ncbi:MAG: helix-turn-helix domain-containing protein [Bacillota bacterium]|nr:helix-turn-helix domain-containing protein [Bacillota bacterium]
MSELEPLREVVVELQALVKRQAEVLAGIERQVRSIGLNSVKEAIEQVTPRNAKQEDELAVAVRGAVSRYLAERPELEPLRPALHQWLLARYRARFGVQRLHHTTRMQWDDAMGWLRTCRFEEPEEKGPLAAAFLRTRAHRGLSAVEAAAAMGVNSQTYGNWERGRTVPKEEFHEAICEYLGLTPGEFGQILQAQRLYCAQRNGRRRS